VDFTLQVLVYAVAAALSPVVLAVTLTVLASGRGRRNGIAYALGFLAGQALVCTVALLAGSSSSTLESRGNEPILGGLEATLGLLLIAAAWRKRPWLPAQPRTVSPRLVALHDRLELGSKLANLSPRLAFTGGAALGVGAKRLVITLLAMAEINVARLLPSEQIGLALLYVAVAGILVWIPVGLYLLSGRRADLLVAEMRAWLTAHERTVNFYVSLLTGVLLVGVGLERIL